jgi:signal transduction histidine kinase
MTPLYTIPVFIAAYFLSPRTTAITGLLVVSCTIVVSVWEGAPAVGWVMSGLGLALTALLALLLAQQRQQTIEQVAKTEVAHRQLELFTGMVAHDARNALGIIWAYLQILQRPDEEKVRRVQPAALEAMQAAAQTLKRLTDDLAEATRLGTGQFHLRLTEADLSLLARTAVERCQIAAVGHSLHLDAPDPVIGTWDSDRVGQVLTNLISNAVKYSPLDTEVQVTVRQVESDAIVSVANQGAGILPEQADALFAPFSRLDPDGPTEGMGLGLYITRAIVHAHGGRIWVESEPDSETCFSVALPLSATERVTPPLPQHVG